jgi:hypothetical protein
MFFRFLTIFSNRLEYSYSHMDLGLELWGATHIPFGPHSVTLYHIDLGL